MLEKDFRIKIVDAFWGEATPEGFNEDGTRIYSIAEAKKDIYQCQSVYAAVRN